MKLQLTHYVNPILILCLTLSLTACGESNNDQHVPQPGSAEPTRTLRIGLIPEIDIFKQKARYQPLADYLGQQLDATVTLRLLERYGNIVSNFEDENLDGAFLGSFVFTLLHQTLHLEPVARPVNLDGSSTYYGVVFVRKDSGIRSALDMKGKRFAFVEKATTAGYLLPLHYFKEEDIADYHSWFSETYYAGTHADAINDVLSKRADAGAAKSTVFNSLAREDKRVADDLLILSRSPDVPETTLAIKATLNPAIKTQLKNTLLAMDTTELGKETLAQFGAQKFIETRDQDYHAVYQYANDIGLDLATYDYQNN